LADGARALLERLDCANVEVRLAGSDLGWPAGAPYDAIAAAAAAPSVPSSLIDQLSASGRLVIPVGPPFEQRLAIIHRRDDGIDVAWGGACRFVPLMGVDGWTGPRDPADGSLPAFDAPVDDE